MAQRPTRPSTRGRAAARKLAGIEWIGGITAMPAYVTGEGEPYRPEVLLWIASDGAVLGSTMARPGELLPMASESLRETTLRPMFGRPHVPTRVRVASSELADVLRAEHPQLDIVCAPTPECDEMFALFHAQMDVDDESGPLSYLSTEVSPEAMAALFTAAASFYRTTPWKVVSDDQNVFSVTIDALNVRDAVVSVFGQYAEAFGFVVFACLDDFEVFLYASDSIERGELPYVPPHYSLNFELGTELAPELRTEIAAHRWEVAGPNAYPFFAAVDEGLVLKPLTDRDVTVIQAIAAALTRVMPEKRALRKAWRGDAPFVRTLSVATHAGELSVNLLTPYMRAPVDFSLRHDILADLAAIPWDDDESSAVAREAVEEALLERFAASPEAKGHDVPMASRVLVDFGAKYLRHTIATLHAADLRAILFELVPKHLSIAASEARPFVDELRAFYTFLKRAFDLRQADACLAVLSHAAVTRLEAALLDPSNFGLAKSLVMAGADAGFNTQSIDGLEAWMRSIEGKPLPPSISLKPFSPSDFGEAHNTQKNKRKAAARKAKKK